MTGALRLAAAAIAVAAVIDPQVERVEPAPVRVGVRVATAAPSPAAERWIAELVDTLPAEALIARELEAPEAPWCVGLDACIVVGDGTVTIGGRPERPVQVVRVPAPEGATVVAASSAPGQASELHEARIAVAGGGDGQAVDVVIDDAGVEVGRLTHRRTDQPIDLVKVPWWPRGLGLRALTARIDGSGAVAPAPNFLGDTSATSADVLVWDVRPSWTGTFVRRALEGDRRLVVRAASQFAPRQLVRRGVAGPPGDAELYRARAVVVSGAAALEAAQVARLERYARAGGSLVVVLDEPPVGAVLALMPGPSSRPRREPDAVPLGPSLRAAEVVGFAERSGDAVLAAWDGAPPGQRAVIVERRTGRGRIVVSGALDAWRWRDTADGFDRFWQGLVVRAARASPPPLGISWASPPGPRVQVSSRRGIADGVWPALDLARICGDLITPIAAAEGPVPGTWLADVPGMADGCRVRAMSGVERVEASWPGPPTLPTSPPAQDALEALATVTGGTVRDSASGAADLARLIADTTRPLVPATWHPMRAWGWLVPFVGALCGEWWLRRRRGLA